MVILPPHPFGIKPTGNLYTASENAKSAAGLFSVLPDEVILQIFEFLTDRLLLRLGATCKALYAFSTLDELWKTLLIGYVFNVLMISGKFLGISGVLLSESCKKGFMFVLVSQGYLCTIESCFVFDAALAFISVFIYNLFLSRSIIGYLAAICSLEPSRRHRRRIYAEYMVHF